MNKKRLINILQEKNLINYVTFIQDEEVTESLISDIYNKIEKVDDRAVRINCGNSFQRKIVHIIAEALGLNHGRYGDLIYPVDRECMCRYCYEGSYRICGVWVSTDFDIKITRIDKFHRKEGLKN